MKRFISLSVVIVIVGDETRQDDTMGTDFANMKGMTEKDAPAIIDEIRKDAADLAAKMEKIKLVLVAEKKACNAIVDQSRIDNWKADMDDPDFPAEAKAKLAEKIEKAEANLARQGKKGRDMFKFRNGLLRVVQKEQVSAIVKAADEFTKAASDEAAEADEGTTTAQ